MDSPKTPFWTTVSPHDPFAAPLARPDKSHPEAAKSINAFNATITGLCNSQHSPPKKTLTGLNLEN